jgi:hypothetical protein
MKQLSNENRRKIIQPKYQNHGYKKCNATGDSKGISHSKSQPNREDERKIPQQRQMVYCSEDERAEQTYSISPKEAVNLPSLQNKKCKKGD